MTRWFPQSDDLASNNRAFIRGREMKVNTKCQTTDSIELHEFAKQYVTHSIRIKCLNIEERK